MKKGLFTAILCVIVAAIIIVTATLFIKSLGNPGDEPLTPNDEPSIGESDDPNDTTTTAPDDTTTAVPNDSTTNVPEDSTTTVPEDNTTGEQTPPSVSSNQGLPQSYTDFSVTKGLSAEQAYEKLNTFLESKYSILINKQNKVESTYQPTDLAIPSGCQYQMEKTAGQALVQMLADARSNGISDLILYSGYRTYASQKNKYETRTQKYLNQGYSQSQAEEKAGEYIAPPGSSEHHTGLAADVCSSAIVSKYGYLSDEFDTTKEYKWMSENCAKYGFIVRYKKDSEDITGFLYEPWHLRYIGPEHATACTELGITYEEYHALLVKLRDMAKSDINA